MYDSRVKCFYGTLFKVVIAFESSVVIIGLTEILLADCGILKLHSSMIWLVAQISLLLGAAIVAAILLVLMLHINA